VPCSNIHTSDLLWELEAKQRQARKRTCDAHVVQVQEASQLQPYGPFGHNFVLVLCVCVRAACRVPSASASVPSVPRDRVIYRSRGGWGCFPSNFKTAVRGIWGKTAGRPSPWPAAVAAWCVAKLKARAV
jgi:hypothetical protein